MNIGLIIVVVVIVLLLLYVLGTYNTLVKLRNKVRNQWSQIDIVLKRRADLIPNLVETVKGYAAHEKGTLEDVIRARNTYVSATSQDEEVKSAGELTTALNKLLMLTEAYPELKANENFVQLQKDLKETEDKITYARQFYNDGVNTYANKLEMFPSNIVASIFGFKPFTYFEVEAADKEVPKVSF